VHPPRSSSQLSPRHWSPRTFTIESRIILDVVMTPPFLRAPSFSPPGAVVLSSLLEPVRLLLLAATSVLHFPPPSSYQFASYFWQPRVCTVFPPPCLFQFASYFWGQGVCLFNFRHWLFMVPPMLIARFAIRVVALLIVVKSTPAAL
jgi:hypothetical protein